MPDPANLVEGILITAAGGLATDFAKSGWKTLLERAQSPTSAMRRGRRIIDLTNGVPVTARLSVRFSTIPEISRPYWLHFGIRPAGGQPETISVCGDSLELRVARGEYEVFALFLTMPVSPSERPLVLAFGNCQALVAQQRQLLYVQGRQLDRDQIRQIKAMFPCRQLPFELPIARTRLPNAKTMLAAAKGMLATAKSRPRP